jgi:predicted RNA-binding protein YlxR (DUF448 family)
MAGKSGKSTKPGKHIPQRTCIGCRQVLNKRGLTRIVRTPDGVFVDKTGKLNGRGAYLHDNLSCWEKALKGPLSSALRTELTEDDRQRLAVFAATLKPVPAIPKDQSPE